MKYSTTFNNNDLFYISLHGGFDSFSYSINDTIGNRILDKKTGEETSQFGGSIYYGNTLENGNTNSFRLSYSGLNSFYRGEVGISLLNILNTENHKYTSFERIPVNQTKDINILAGAIPFTPALHLKISM